MRAVRGRRQPVEEALHRVVLEQLLERPLRGARVVLETGLHRGREVRDVRDGHCERLQVGAHRALDVAHTGVPQERVELPSAALSQPRRLQGDVHAELVPIPEAINEGLLRS